MKSYYTIVIQEKPKSRLVQLFDQMKKNRKMYIIERNLERALKNSRKRLAKGTK